MQERGIVTRGGGGVTSCLSVRLHDAVGYYNKHGVYPEFIDSSNQFGFYQDEPGQDISKLILADYKPDNSIPIVGYDHGWQFAWYDEIELHKLSPLASMICPMSQAVGDKCYQFMSRIDGRTAVLYRGNDKALDIPRTHYNAMIQMAAASYQASGCSRFIVQTDEVDFFKFFKEAYPDSIKFNEIPQIKKDPDAFVMPKSHRADFCINFISALRAIATAPQLLTNTGNTGIWTMLFRGHTKGVWQVHGKNQQISKLN